MTAQTLSDEVLAKMNAPSQEADGVPILEDPTQLEAYDAFLFGIPTRLGNFPAQWRVFWDATGKQWFNSKYWVRCVSLPCSRCSLADNLVHLIGQIRWSLRLERRSRWWSREYSNGCDEHALPSRHHLRATWIQDRFQAAYRPVGGARWESMGCEFALLLTCSLRRFISVPRHETAADRVFVYRPALWPITMGLAQPRSWNSKSRLSKGRPSTATSRGFHSHDGMA